MPPFTARLPTATDPGPLKLAVPALNVIPPTLATALLKLAVPPWTPLTLTAPKVIGVGLLKLAVPPSSTNAPAQLIGQTKLTVPPCRSSVALLETVQVPPIVLSQPNCSVPLPTSSVPAFTTAAWHGTVPAPGLIPIQP